MTLTASLVLAVILAGVLMPLALRMARLEQQLRRLSRVEGKLDVLLQQAGVRYDPYGNAPSPVVEALRQGKKIEAIKRYREATRASLEEAKEFVEEVQRRF